MTLPARLVAGDTVSFLVAVADYPATAGWTLKLRLIPRFASPTQAPILLTASAEGEQYRVTETAANTSSWAAGLYGWQTWVEDATRRFTLEGTQYAGEIRIAPNPTGLSQGADTRSRAQKALEDAQQALADAVTRRAGVGTGASDVEEYSIGDRRVKYASLDTAITSLTALISQLSWEVKRELRADALAKGRPDPRKTYVRLDRG